MAIFIGTKKLLYKTRGRLQGGKRQCARVLALLPLS
jgi:hypothetical protein